MIGLALAAGLAIRAQFLPFESDDYHLFLKHWTRFIETNGGLAALRYPFANYTQPYLYLLSLGLALFPGVRDLYVIKLISTLFDAGCAVLVWKIVEDRRPASLAAAGAFAAVWLSPTVILNSAAWGQVDSMYSAFLLLAVFLMMQERPARGIAAYGAAFAIKLQSIFLLPVVALAALRGRARTLVWIPIVFVALMLPAIALGKPVGDALFTYGLQIGAAERLTMNAANWYQWLPPGEPAAAWWAGVLLGAVFMLFALWCARRWAMPWPEQVLLLACWTLAGVPFFLPRMHDRYFFPAELLAVAFAFSRASTRPVWLLLPVALTGASLSTYLSYLWRFEPVPLGWAAAVVALAVLALTVAGVRAAGKPAIPINLRVLLDGLWPPRGRLEWVAGLIVLMSMAGAAVLGGAVRANAERTQRIATFELDGARASIDRVSAYRCEDRVQIELTWTNVSNFGARGAVSEMTHLYGWDGRRLAVADGFPDAGWKIPFNLLPQAFSEVRQAAIADPAQVRDARLGLYEVDGTRGFGASHPDGAPWPEGAVVVLVRDARPGECERQ